MRVTFGRADGETNINYRDMIHAKPTMTLDHYAKWLPSGEQRFVDVLDTRLEKVGTMS